MLISLCIAHVINEAPYTTGGVFSLSLFLFRMVGSILSLEEMSQLKSNDQDV